MVQKTITHLPEFVFVGFIRTTIQNVVHLIHTSELTNNNKGFVKEEKKNGYRYNFYGGHFS